MHEGTLTYALGKDLIASGKPNESSVQFHSNGLRERKPTAIVVVLCVHLGVRPAIYARWRLPRPYVNWSMRETG
jgi:hypothetical protein